MCQRSKGNFLKEFVMVENIYKSVDRIFVDPRFGERLGPDLGPETKISDFPRNLTEFSGSQ